VTRGRELERSPKKTCRVRRCADLRWGGPALSGNLTLRLNTAAGPITQTKVPHLGTDNVNPDCTVEDIWVNQLNGGSNVHESILVDNGRELFILVTTAGTPPVVTASGRKLFAGESDRN
jgi:hypothetical protein